MPLSGSIYPDRRICPLLQTPWDPTLPHPLQVQQVDLLLELCYTGHKMNNLEPLPGPVDAFSASNTSLSNF